MTKPDVQFLGQEPGIVPPNAPSPHPPQRLAVLHIHATRAESNKCGFRGNDCLTWEKQLIVRCHKQTLSQLWEPGNWTFYVCDVFTDDERRWGWMYPCEHACRRSRARRRTFLHLQVSLLSRFMKTFAFLPFSLVVLSTVKLPLWVWFFTMSLTDFFV